MTTTRCPKCDGKTYWREISSGGDGLHFCTNCDWVDGSWKDDDWMKIVKNNCYGGFSVSKEVADKLKEKGYDLGEGSKTNFTDGSSKWSFSLW